MNHIKNIFTNCILLLSISFFIISCNPKDRYVTFSGYAQGGTYTIKANLKGVKIKPEQIKFKVDSILNLIDTTLSGYNKGSILSRFNEGKNVKPNDMFIEIYDLSSRLYDETGGALDVAAAPLFDAWGFGFTTDSLPSESQVEELQKSCGMSLLKSTMEEAIDAEGFLSGDMLYKENISIDSYPKLNYNAIAQGYSCDKVADYLYGIGVKDMLVDIGEIYCDGLNPKGIPWTIAVDRPVDGNNSPGADIDGIWRSSGKGCGVVTSGNYRKFYVKDGVKYSHTIDPRNGFPVQHNLLSATIVAPTATLADAYATYCMVIGLEEAQNFISSKPDIEGYLIYSKADSMVGWYSDGFNLIEK